MSCAKVRVKGDGWGGGTGECAKWRDCCVEVSCITLTKSQKVEHVQNYPIRDLVFMTVSQVNVVECFLFQGSSSCWDVWSEMTTSLLPLDWQCVCGFCVHVHDTAKLQNLPTLEMGFIDFLYFFRQISEPSPRLLSVEFILDIKLPRSHLYSMIEHDTASLSIIKHHLDSIIMSCSIIQLDEGGQTSRFKHQTVNFLFLQFKTDLSWPAMALGLWAWRDWRHPRWRRWRRCWRRTTGSDGTWDFPSKNRLGTCFYRWWKIFFFGRWWKFYSLRWDIPNASECH